MFNVYFINGCIVRQITRYTITVYLVTFIPLPLSRSIPVGEDSNLTSKLLEKFLSSERGAFEL